MQRSVWKRWLTFQGRVGRLPYLLSGIALLAIKYAIDSTVASHYGQPWHLWNYFLPAASLTVFAIEGPLRALYLILWTIAIPFFWIGLSLTLCRLRDAGQNIGWLCFFFVPFANLLFFLFLAAAPTAPPVKPLDAGMQNAPFRSSHRASVLAASLACLLGIGLVYLSANQLGQYGWGLFLCVPFLVGLVSSWLYNARALHTVGQTSLVCSATTLCIGFGLISLHLEGLICLIMALPLCLPFAIAGGIVAHTFLKGHQVDLTPPRITACVAILPLLLFAEHAIDLQPPVSPVVTTIIIDAPVAVVWKNVIAFPPLAPPTDLLFRTGIAYPIGATIQGTGPGAIRRCRFSTGDFVEPITVWNENHLLAFNVISEPPSLHEIGFGIIHTPHNDRNYTLACSANCGRTLSLSSKQSSRTESGTKGVPLSSQSLFVPTSAFIGTYRRLCG